MTKTLIIILIIQSTLAFSQKPLTKEDSILLSKTWTKLIQNFSSKNILEIKKASFKEIDCLRCMTDDEQMKVANSGEYLVPVDTFITTFFKLIPNSKLWTVMKSKEKPIFWLHHSGNFYEVLVHTYKTNELAKEHEGGQDIFEFKKVGTSFKLCGFTSVP